MATTSKPTVKPKSGNIGRIGRIGNYYGSLNVKKDTRQKCYWGIEDWDGIKWDEIPKSLFTALVRYEKSRKKI